MTHVLSNRKRKIDSIPQSIIDKLPNYCSTDTVKSNDIHILTANITPKRPTTTNINTDNDNKPYWYDIFVRVTNVSSSPEKLYVLVLITLFHL